jgi:hypothetical protein
MKEKLFQKNPGNLIGLRAMIVHLWREISEEICHVIANIGPRLQKVAQ